MTIQEIKALMKENKITQIDLSEKSSIPLATLRHIFSGSTLNPRKDTMDTILTTLINNYDVSIKVNEFDIDEYIKTYNYCIIVIDHLGNARKFNFKKENIEQILSVCDSITKDYKKS